MVDYSFEDIEPLELDFEALSQWFSSLCIDEYKVLEEINVVFCSDEYLLSMNIEHLDHDYYTDIITFDYCIDNQVFGDLFISLDRVKDNSISNKVLFLNELYRVCFHGLLHLCGYLDKSPDDITLMRSKEDHYLSLYVSRET